MITIFRRYVNDPTTSEQELHRRTGQPVIVLRPLDDSECDPENQPMFHIKFADGFEADAFGEELQEE